jgi:Leucine-rich repeat (LRR) protein
MFKSISKVCLAAIVGGTALASASAQGTITMQTEAPVGTEIRLLLNAVSTTAPIKIDYGNGVEVSYTIDPTAMTYTRWVTGVVEGSTIKVSGNVTELELTDAQLTAVSVSGMSHLTTLELNNNEITSFELLDETPLTNLNLSHNNLTNSTTENPTLTLENAGSTLSTLNLSYNPGLICLNISDLSALNYLTMSDCPDLGSVFVCLPEESRPNLKQVNLSNCDLSHFYPVSLPALTTLNLAGNNLMTDSDTDPFVLGDYPALTTLDVSNNGQIESLDVTGCTNLENLNVSDNKLTTIDVSQAAALRTLNIANNKITALDLGNNAAITSLYVSGNPLKALDVADLTNLAYLDMSDTQISRIDLMKSYFLKSFIARNTKLEFVDFNGVQPYAMTMIDLRDNACMTSETVDYTLHTLPVPKSTYNTQPNLLLSGTDYEHADTSYPISSDLGWICDVTGDGTASHNLVAVTLQGATDTGTNISGTVERLYPNFGMSLEYDLDLYETTGGKFLLAQWKPEYYQSIMSVTNEARIGVPMYVYVYPEEGKSFRSVTVNGVEIKSQWFVISEPSTIKVNFSDSEGNISFTTPAGQALSFIVNTAENNGTVEVDWGTGSRTAYTGMSKYETGSSELGGTRIDGTAAGSRVTIYGDIAAIDLSGYGDAAEYFGLQDNHVTSIDLSQANDLRYLNLYWNPIQSIDLSQANDLEFLDISYTMLKTVDLSANSNLLWLAAYSDGYGDEEDGISQLTAIDVTNMPYLQYLDVKGNEISSIDLTKNPWLTWANLSNNNLTSIDLSKNVDLVELNLNSNKLASVDLTNNVALESLTVDNNELTSLELPEMENLTYLSFANNDIHVADLHSLAALQTLYINGNGMTAEELNDLYYNLPQRIETETTSDGTQLSYNLAVIQGNDKTANAGYRCDSSIAIDRGWTPSHQGTNGGCPNAYLDIIVGSHGQSVVVKDEDGNEYHHGDKVTKYAPLTIEAIGEEGYTFKSYSLNGEEPIESTAFNMPGVYTKLTVNFEQGSGVADVATDADLYVGGSRGAIYVKANGKASVEVFAMNGAKVYSSIVNGEGRINLASGVYVISVITDNGQRTAKAVTVK